VKVVTKIDDAIAGSKLSFSSASGTRPPATPAMTRLKIMATKRIDAMIQSCVQRPTTSVVSRPFAAPLPKPTSTSFPISRQPPDLFRRCVDLDAHDALHHDVAQMRRRIGEDQAAQ